MIEKLNTNSAQELGCKVVASTSNPVSPSPSLSGNRMTTAQALSC